MGPGVDAGITKSQDIHHRDPLKKRVMRLLLSLFLTLCASAQESPGTGVSSEEIKIGNITCATGWAREYAAVAGAEAAYFAMVNDRGGINGRKIKFISLDNGCDSQESFALAKQLVEQGGVLLLFSVLGTESNLAIRPYINEKQVPQLFLESSSAVFDDPSHFPWTIGLSLRIAPKAAGTPNTFC